MGSTLMQLMQPQQALMQGGGMPQQPPPVPPPPPAQMPTAMPQGGGMMMPGPQPPQQMGGGKGDVNPLMMLFPGMRHHAEQQQAQQFSQGMQQRELADAEGVNAYNIHKNEALAQEEEGGREAIGKEGLYLADHPASNLQELMKTFKETGIDPKYVGPVLQAYAPLFNKEEQVAIKQAAQNEKTQSDQERLKQGSENLDIRRQNLDLTEQRQGETKRKDLAQEQYKSTNLELRKTQLDRMYDLKTQQVQQQNEKIADAKAKGDQAAAQKAEDERDKIISGASREPAALQIIQNMDDGPEKDKAMSDLQNWHTLMTKTQEHLATPSPPTGGQAPGQPGGSQQPPAAPSGPMKVMNDEDYAKVPAGGSFIDPQGNVRKKSGGVGQ